MKEIILSQGKVALVDEADHAWLSQIKWCANASGGHWYAVRGARPQLKMHQLILNIPDGYDCDHIDGDGLNNQRCNLRICTRSQNLQNQMPQKGGVSRFKGVSWHKRNSSWQVRICLNGKLIHLGYFDSEVVAAKAYDKAAVNYFGEFANLNEVMEILEG